MERPYVQKTSTFIGGKRNITSPSKIGSKYFTSRTSILSKSIAVRSDLELLLDFVIFNASTILKPKEDEEVDVETKDHGELISCTTYCEGFYQHPQRPKPDWKA